MDGNTAKAVIRCLEIDVDFYRDVNIFLLKKHAKILEDDLDWLTESLNKEQAILMKSRALEEKRLKLFGGLGIENRKLSELAEEAPEEYKPKIRMLSNSLTDIIENITKLNTETTEIVKRKLDNQKELVAKTGILNKPEIYNKNAAKVQSGQSAAQTIRQV